MKAQIKRLVIKRILTFSGKYNLRMIKAISNIEMEILQKLREGIETLNFDFIHSVLTELNFYVGIIQCEGDVDIFIDDKLRKEFSSVWNGLEDDIRGKVRAWRPCMLKVIACMLKVIACMLKVIEYFISERKKRDKYSL